MLVCFAHEVKAGREVRVHELEEEVSERSDLCPTGHVDTLGTQRHHEGEVGAGEGEDGQREHLLDTERERERGGGVRKERGEGDLTRVERWRGQCIIIKARPRASTSMHLHHV